MSLHRLLTAAPHRSLHWRCVLLLIAILAMGQSGCVRRRLTVRSWPPGAQVFIDDQEIGTTPCSTSFIYYGTRKVTLIKGGFRSETLYHKIPPPWYQLPPLDFVTENLVPQEIRDERIIDIQLVPEEVVPPEQLLERAQGLRDSSRAGFVTPLPTVPGATPPPAAPQTGVPGQGLPGGEPLLYDTTPPVGSASAPPSGTSYLPIPPLPQASQP